MPTVHSFLEASILHSWAIHYSHKYAYFSLIVQYHFQPWLTMHVSNYYWFLNFYWQQSNSPQIGSFSIPLAVSYLLSFPKDCLVNLAIYDSDTIQFNCNTKFCWVQTRSIAVNKNCTAHLSPSSFSLIPFQPINGPDNQYRKIHHQISSHTTPTQSEKVCNIGIVSTTMSLHQGLTLTIIE